MRSFKHLRAVIVWALAGVILLVLITSLTTWARLGTIYYIRGNRAWFLCSYYGQIQLTYEHILKDDAHFTRVVTDPDSPGSAWLENDALYEPRECLNDFEAGPFAWRKPAVLYREQTLPLQPVSIGGFVLPFAVDAMWASDGAWTDVRSGKMTSEPGKVSFECHLPHWLVVTLIGGLMWFLLRPMRRARRMRRRQAAGLCGNCGYDLRGSRDKCPECGTVTPRAPGLAGPWNWTVRT